MKLPPRVEVIWQDADAGSVWVDRADIEEWAATPHICITRGWEAYRDKGCVMVATSYDTANSKFGGIIKIPAAFILKVKGGSK